jgi:hypothetical protein
MPAFIMTAILLDYMHFLAEGREVHGPINWAC